MTLREIEFLVHEKFFELSREKTPKEYASDWNASADVAKAMKDEWLDFSIQGTAEGNWRVCWGFDERGRKGVDASTCQLALCLAALISKNIPIEKAE